MLSPLRDRLFPGLVLASVLASAARAQEDAASAPQELPLLGGPRFTLADLDTPRGVALAPDGTIYAVESGRSRVRVFEADGRERASFGARGRGPGELLRPEGIARASDGRLWIADAGNHRLSVFDAEGVFVTHVGELGAADGAFHTPIGVAARAGEIAVADSRNARVQVFDEQGAWLRTLTATPSGVLQRPVGVAYDDTGALYVTDADLHRVVVYAAASAEPAREWGDWGWFPALFSEPSAIALVRDYAFVADRENHRIQVLDPAGAYRHKWGIHAILPREGDGKLHYPSFLAVRDDGALALVSEPLDDRVQAIGPASEDDIVEARLRDSAGQASPHYGVLLELSEPWLAIDEPETHSVLLYDLRLGEPVLVSKIGGYGTTMGTFRRPSGIVLDASARRAWVCDAGNRRLHEIALRGSFDDEIGFDAQMAVFVRMLDFDRLGRSVAGVELEWPIEPAGLARSPDGMLYVLDARNERVHVIDSDLALVKSFGGHGDGPGRLAGPTDLCWSSTSAMLYVVDADNRRVQGFGADGALRSMLRVDGMDRPFGVAVLPDESVAVSDWGAHRVLVLSPANELRACIGERGIGAGELYKPRGVAASADALYVLDHANHRGMIFENDGRWRAAFGSRPYTRPTRANAGSMERADD